MPRQGNKDTVLTLQAQALEAHKDLLGPEVTAQLREKLSQKWEPPKTVEDKLAEKKRELDKKIAYTSNLQLQQEQMMAKLAQHAARVDNHRLSLVESQQQVAVLQREYDDLREEYQSGPPQMQCVEVDSADEFELDSADQPLPTDGAELAEPPEGAKKRKKRWHWSHGT